MPRDLPLGNGNMLVAFDQTYTIRDLFWPHVGSENHLSGHRCRLGFWVDGKFAWTLSDGWQRDLHYENETLVTAVRLVNATLNLAVRISDTVDFAIPAMVRKFVIEPTGAQDVRMFLGLDLYIYGNPIGDTALYKPDIRALIHYKDARYFLHGGIGANGALDQFACGQKAFNNQEGSWRDAEDGMLDGNPIAQGSVDSVIGLHADGDPSSERTIYAWLAIGKHIDDVERIHERVRVDPEKFLERTRNYWRLWANKEHTDFGPMPANLIAQYKRSLLTVRTQIDDGGGILAANDSDNEAFNADTYSYVWPRDGALVAFALDEAGRNEIANRFFNFCGRIIYRDGYFLHKYNADGTLASSWHPYYYNGAARLPIQEDETALVLWSLWHHFEVTRSVESVKDLYAKVIIPAGTFLSNYVDPTGLCKPSWDLWEERWGIHAFTVGAVYGGLEAAANFARSFGEVDDARRFELAAQHLKAAVRNHFLDETNGRFARMILRQDDGSYAPDWTADSAILGLLYFGMFDLKEPVVMSAIERLFERLRVKTDIGGYARYENDRYFQASKDTSDIPGNPWFICTLWRARFIIAKAQNLQELEGALELFEWVVKRALPSGILSEQIDPRTGEQLSVSPLTWSHAEYVSTFLAYLDKLSTLGLCPTCHRPLYMREHERLTDRHENSAAFNVAT